MLVLFLRIPIFLLLAGFNFSQTAGNSQSNFKVFFPQQSDGLVNKYYYHVDREEGYDPYTIIEYRKYQWIRTDELLVEFYNPAYQLQRSARYKITENQMIVLSDRQFLQGETYETLIEQSVFMDWGRDTATYQASVDYQNGRLQSILIRQLSQGDTTLLERPAKFFRFEQQYTTQHNGNPTQPVTITVTDYFVEGLGLFVSHRNLPAGKGRLELIEQITVEEFKKRQQHVVKRVAYIDPSKVLDVADSFSPCEKQERIVDYYNGDPDAGIPGGKKALKKLLEKHLDPAKLKGASGYLTFRFVISCEGKAGWFVTEQADLDFQPASFDEVTISHLLSILKKQALWRSTSVRGEVRDAYAYITFKLKDGAIIEYLP